MASNAQPRYWGTVYRSGARGPDVALIQTWLNGIRSRWPAIQRLNVDGIYGRATATAVKTFQTVAGIAADGTVGPVTWDRLYDAYAALNGEGEVYPGIPARSGDEGAVVKSAQQRLKALVPELAADGKYGAKTENAVRAWQTVHGLAADGVLGANTWRSLYGA